MTRSADQEPMPVAQLRALADAFGGDLERWPAGMRPAAVQLVAADDAARVALAEARALDRLLDAAAGPVPMPGADLLDRIVAAASGNPAASRAQVVSVEALPVEAVTTQVVAIAAPAAVRTAIDMPLPSRAPKPQPVAASLPPARRPSARRVAFRNWPVAAALAASLALGITLGAHDLTHAPVRGLVDIASADADVDHFVAVLHADGIAVAMDEEHP